MYVSHVCKYQPVCIYSLGCCFNVTLAMLVCMSVSCMLIYMYTMYVSSHLSQHVSMYAFGNSCGIVLTE